MEDQYIKKIFINHIEIITGRIHTSSEGICCASKKVLKQLAPNKWQTCSFKNIKARGNAKISAVIDSE